MNCIGAMDGRLLACPHCFKRLVVCYQCNGKPITITKPCPECKAHLNEENIHQIGFILEGELFFFTSKGESDALHTSKYKSTVYHNRAGTVYHNRAGIRINVMSALTSKQVTSNGK